MTAMMTTLASNVTRKFLRGLAVIIMLSIYGAGLVGVTGLMSAATSTQADAGWRGRGRRGWGRRGWRGRRGWGRRGWRGRRGWGRRGWWGGGWGGPGIYLYIR